MTGRWFVYALMESDVVIYIGKGSGRRHLISQRRHGGKAFILEWFQHESEALKREKQLIRKYTPALNKTAGGEGKSHKRRLSDEVIAKRLLKTAYAKENSGNWLDKIAAICYRKTEGISPSNGELKWLTEVTKELMRRGVVKNHETQPA